MILIGQYDSPYVRRVAATLHHYEMPFERNAISVFSDADEMARINPLVRIPSLALDDGETLIDSAAILDHLDETVGPMRALTPGSGRERRLVMQLIALATGAIDKAGAVVYERHFHAPGAVNEDWAARCMSQIKGALTALEQRLDGEWLALGRFTQADLTTAAMLFYLKLRAIEIDIAQDFPALADLSDRCEQMPIFKAARPAAGEAMPQ
ncbi:MAG: glutathione S-transferase family protein [Pseudomonadota bacterium]